jgi:hypothetical protein
LCVAPSGSGLWPAKLARNYGAGAKLFGDVIEKGFLPEDRAVGCKREYIQLSRALDSLIGPHIDRRIARKLHESWLPPATAQPKTWRWTEVGHSSYDLDHLFAVPPESL